MTTDDKMFAVEDNRDAVDVMMCYLEGRVSMDEVVDKGCKQIEDIIVDKVKGLVAFDSFGGEVFKWDNSGLEENGYSFEVGA